MTMKDLAILLSLTATAACVAAQPVRAGEAACDAQPVYSVAAANLEIGKDTITVNAYGMASTLGWKSLTLKRVTGNGDPATAVYEFVGCRPQFAAEVMTPVSATVTMTTGAGSVTRVIIKAKTNSQALDVAEFRGKVHADDPQVK